MQLSQARKQKVWGWPALANFILGGTATSFYLLNFLIARLQGNTHSMSQSVALYLLPPALVGLGFLCLTIEAGRPLRGSYLFRRPLSSWMSRETIAGAIFIPAVVLDFYLSHPLLQALSTAAAAGLIISQGFIVYRAVAVTAWNVPIVPPLFVTSSFVTGAGLLLIASNELTSKCSQAATGMICIVTNLVVWLLYLHWSRDASFRKAIEELSRLKAIFLTVGIGHLLPILVLSFYLIGFGDETNAEFPSTAFDVAGVAMIFGSTIQKAYIILRVGYQRGIALEEQ